MGAFSERQNLLRVRGGFEQQFEQALRQRLTLAAAEDAVVAFLGGLDLRRSGKHLCHDEPHPDSPAGGI